MQLTEGARIATYSLERRLGKGAFGEIWKGRHLDLEREVALKIPTSPTAVESLRKEGLVQNELDHPGIVRTIDLNTRHEPPYVVMEYVAGPDLRQVLKGEGRLPAARAGKIFARIVTALAHAHERGVVHGDLKPANIILEADDRPRITDFGLSRRAADQSELLISSLSMSLEESQEVSGTLAYMAPEQREGKPIDARADVYALGVILFEMLAGRRPEGIERPSEIAHGLLSRLDHVFGRCYTRRQHRYPDAGSMLPDVLPWSGDAIPPPPVAPPVAPPPLPSAPPPPPPPARGQGATSVPGVRVRGPGGSCTYHPGKDATGRCTSCSRSFCPLCLTNREGRLVCMDCAGRPRSKRGPKDPATAGILGLFLPGVGLLYANPALGIVLWGFAILMMLGIAGTSMDEDAAFGLLFLAYVASLVLGVTEAQRQRKNFYKKR